jgi:hypothetical protein
MFELKTAESRLAWTIIRTVELSHYLNTLSLPLPREQIHIPSTHNILERLIRKL